MSQTQVCPGKPPKPPPAPMYIPYRDLPYRDFYQPPIAMVAITLERPLPPKNMMLATYKHLSRVIANNELEVKDKWAHICDLQIPLQKLVVQQLAKKYGLDLLYTATILNCFKTNSVAVYALELFERFDKTFSQKDTEQEQLLWFNSIPAETIKDRNFCVSNEALNYTNATGVRNVVYALCLFVALKMLDDDHDPIPARTAGQVIFKHKKAQNDYVIFEKRFLMQIQWNAFVKPEVYIEHVKTLLHVDIHTSGWNEVQLRCFALKQQNNERLLTMLQEAAAPPPDPDPPRRRRRRRRPNTLPKYAARAVADSSFWDAHDAKMLQREARAPVPSPWQTPKHVKRC